MKKLKLAAYVSIFFATQAFALEIQNGKILSHKEWSTGHARVAFKSSKLKLDGQAGELVAISLDIFHGVVGQPITWAPAVYVEHLNLTDDVEHVNYLVNACILYSDNNTECVYYQDNIELAPGGKIAGGDVPEMTMTFDHPGNYSITSSALIYGDAEIMSVTDSKIIVSAARR